MKKNNNAIWRFFASVKLALFVLFLLALTSIIGTVLPQNQPPLVYTQFFNSFLHNMFSILNMDSGGGYNGQGLAQVALLLDFDDMYGSWWFLGLLLLFSLNLIVCTLDRLPNVWGMVVKDYLATPTDRLEKMGHRLVCYSQDSVADTSLEAAGLLQKSGWSSKQKTDAGETVLFSQKGAWSRLGVYGVHISILFIFAGAIIGSLTGFKGSVMIPEGSSTDKMYEYGTGNPIPLGFTVQCDSFGVDYYDNGAPKEYRSRLTVKDPAAGKEFSKKIVVNDPLDYKGITFYQSSYEPLKGFKVLLVNKENKTGQSFQVPFGKKINWPGTGIDFGIINQQARSRMGDVVKMKIWFSDGKGDPLRFWMDNNTTRTISRENGDYEISAGQLYATGLQVAKDPGVWTVYFGCSLMLIGLYVAFFLSHRRVWVYIKQENGRSRILVSGTSNKNRLGFEKDFSAIADSFSSHQKFNSGVNKSHGEG